MVTESTDDEIRWKAVESRMRDQGDPFVFGVLTTGVFCRPGCPARIPQRRNVVFFESPHSALSAGFRPCRRCCPLGSAPEVQRTAMIVRACRRIQAAWPEPSLRELADEAELSPAHFQRQFKAIVGLSPKQFAQACRRQRLRDIRATSETATRAIQEAGYTTMSSAYRQGAARGNRSAETIRCVVAATGLGPVVIGISDRGVCLIEFLGQHLGQQWNTRSVDVGTAADDDAIALVRSRFPAAHVESDHRKRGKGVSDIVARIVAMIDEPARAVELPLDIRGTAFQERVWRALQQIPTGTTVSYATLAADLGKPGAARAVAQACASNRLAVVIPCHRVIRGSGDLAGYRWGIDRKRELLDRECAQMRVTRKDGDPENR